MSGMNIRRATEADQPALRELWEEFEAEIPAPPEFVETWDEEWQDVSADIGGRGVVYLAEDDEGVAGARSGDHAARRRLARRVRARPAARAPAGRAQAADGTGAGGGPQPRLDAGHARRDGGQPRGGDRLEAARLRAREAVHGGAAGSSSPSGPEASNAGRRTVRSSSRPTTTTRSSRRSRSTCRGSAGRPQTDRRPAAATAGRASTTSSAAATRTRSGGSGARCRSRSARSC